MLRLMRSMWTWLWTRIWHPLVCIDSGIRTRWIPIDSSIRSSAYWQRHLLICSIRRIHMDSGICSSAHPLIRWIQIGIYESQIGIMCAFTCFARLIFFPDFLDVWWSQHNALISRHRNSFTPKNWMNPFRYVLGTRRWLVFAIYCLLGGLVP